MVVLIVIIALMQIAASAQSDYATALGSSALQPH